jgi:glycosyltransferase involved in cell wall biosynthesis
VDLVRHLGCVRFYTKKAEAGLKVLFFSHQANFLYGGEICTLAFMEELNQQGVEVHFASPPGPYQERARAFAKVHTVPSRQFSRKLNELPQLLPAIWQTGKALEEIMVRENISILHCTSLKAMVYGWRLGSRWPVIWHHHDILPPGRANDWWVRRLGARARLVLVPSCATKDGIERAGLPPGLCQVMPNGFRVDSWRARPSREGGHFRVALVGEISPRKGTDRLPGILRALAERGGVEGFEFLVVGDGLSAPAFAGEMRQVLKNQPVLFLGRREDVKQILQGVDLLLVPSRQDPLPTVIVEASLSGVPAVGSRAGGIPEMIVHGETGYLAESDEEFAEALLLARELSTWERLRVNARLRAEQKFNIRRLAEELVAHYGRLSG